MSTILKPLSFKIPKVQDSVLYVQEDTGERFYERLHNHPEIQITYIKKGNGTLICGEHMGEFTEGDLFIVGSNVAHVFNNRPNASGVHSITLFIDPRFFANDLIPHDERAFLIQVEEESNFGMRIEKSAAETLIPKLEEVLIKRSELSRLATVFSFFADLKRLKSYALLSSRTPTQGSKLKEEERLNGVIQFLLENYDREISLDEIAGVAALSKSSFCRYFKQRTGKTYTDYLAGIRINIACQLLHDRSYSISDSCFESGFSNVSHFNRKFKRIKGVTPSTYRKNLFKSVNPA